MKIGYLLDASGSMGPVQEQVISAFNEYVESLKKDSKGKKIRFTCHAFGGNNPAFRIHDNVKVKNIKVLTNDVYIPDGMTPLYDAIYVMVKTLRGKNNLVIIHTDGYENNSQHYNQREIFDIIRDKEDNKGWTFMYIGSDADTWEQAASIGVQRGNTVMYHQYDQHEATRNATLGTQAYISKTNNLTED